MRSKTLPVVAATINGIALRIADIAEFQPRGSVDSDGQILVELFVYNLCMYAHVCYSFCYSIVSSFLI